MAAREVIGLTRMSKQPCSRPTCGVASERGPRRAPRSSRRDPGGTKPGALAAGGAGRSRERERAASIAPAGGFSMFRADRGDLLAGLIIAAVGGWFLVGAFDYRIGTAVRKIGSASCRERVCQYV